MQKQEAYGIAHQPVWRNHEIAPNQRSSRDYQAADQQQGREPARNFEKALGISKTVHCTAFRVAHALAGRTAGRKGNRP